MFLEYTKKKLINKSIVEYLQVKNQDIISVSGAGGKTSTIKLLAKNLVRKHKKVLITTTTKMFKTADAITIRDKNLLKQKLEQQNWVFTGQDYGKKISSWDEEFLREIISLADITLIEADGAKRLPFKYPKQNEPVYISSSNKVVYIVGMSALNQPLKSLCRAELLAKFLQKQVNENLTKNDIIKVISSEQGARKDIGKRDFFVILNQVDTLFALKEAIFIAEKLTECKIKVAISSYRDEF